MESILLRIESVRPNSSICLESEEHANTEPDPPNSQSVCMIKLNGPRSTRVRHSKGPCRTLRGAVPQCRFESLSMTPESAMLARFVPAKVSPYPVSHVVDETLPPGNGRGL